MPQRSKATCPDPGRSSEDKRKRGQRAQEFFAGDGCHGLVQLQLVKHGDLRRRSNTMWAKEAVAKYPDLVVKLESLPERALESDAVYAVNVVVPHTCRSKSVNNDDEVSSARSSPGPRTPAKNHSNSLVTSANHPNLVVTSANHSYSLVTSANHSSSDVTSAYHSNCIVTSANQSNCIVTSANHSNCIVTSANQLNSVVTFRTQT